MVHSEFSNLEKDGRYSGRFDLSNAGHKRIEGVRLYFTVHDEGGRVIGTTSSVVGYEVNADGVRGILPKGEASMVIRVVSPNGVPHHLEMVGFSDMKVSS